MDKVKVKFLRPVGMYKTGDIGELRQSQVEVLGNMVELVVQSSPKPSKKAANKSMSGRNKAKTK